jgi:hypothetical protein
MSKLFPTSFLHPLIYFIADKPAKDNIAAHVPLVGTQSYKTLLEWIGEMNVDITRVRMYNQTDAPFDNVLSQISLNRAITLKQICVVALGQKASTYLKKVGINDYFILPHPSGKNFQLNDHAFVKDRLEQCKEFIYDKKS